MSERKHPQSAPSAAGTEVSTSTSDRWVRELRRRIGKRPSPGANVEHILHAEGLSPADIDRELLMDLVYAEWILRFELGESPCQDEYRARFPMIVPLLERQWELDHEVANLSAATDWELSVTTSLSEKKADDEQLPAMIGKYRVISRLGAGGQGEVYRALHPDLNRDVVIKAFRPLNVPTQLMDATSAELALAEGRIAAQLSHPHVARVYDVGLDAGRPFLVMEYLPGRTLDQFHLAQPLAARQIAAVMARIARAVAAAHSLGILHRDLKPQNIVMSDQGEPTLIDFGLAGISDVWNPGGETPGLRGTLGYMAPEQAASNSAVGPAADIFGLGAVLYFLLTGRAPYYHSSSITGVCVAAVLKRVRRCEWDRKELISPQVPSELAQICRQAMAVEPGARFKSAIAFAEAMEAFAIRPAPGHRRAVLAIMMVTLAVASYTLWQTRPQVVSSSNVVASKGVLPTHRVRANLRIVIHRDDEIFELADSVPLADDTRISLHGDIPAGFSIMLFSINGKGELQAVSAETALPHDRKWRYPLEMNQTVNLTGPSGTECLLVAGTADPGVSAEQILTAWNRTEWPTLPPMTILRLVGTKVTTEQTGRDLSLPITTGLSPTEQITRSLAQFATEIGGQFPLVEAVIFRHIPNSESTR